MEHLGPKSFSKHQLKKTELAGHTNESLKKIQNKTKNSIKFLPYMELFPILQITNKWSIFKVKDLKTVGKNIYRTAWPKRYRWESMSYC